MDRAVDEVNLNNVMHIRAHPVGHRKDETFLYFEVHFTSIGKGLYPSPWELRTSSVVKLLVPVNNSNPLYLSVQEERTSWINAIEAYAPNCNVRGKINST